MGENEITIRDYEHYLVGKLIGPGHSVSWSEKNSHTQGFYGEKIGDEKDHYIIFKTPGNNPPKLAVVHSEKETLKTTHTFAAIKAKNLANLLGHKIIDESTKGH